MWIYKLFAVCLLLRVSNVSGTSNNGTISLSPRMVAALSQAADMLPQLRGPIADLVNLTPQKTAHLRKAASGYSQVLTSMPRASASQNPLAALQPLIDLGLISQDQVNSIGAQLVALGPQLLTNKCYLDIYTIFNALSNISDPWALQFLDATAKPGPSILRGNVNWLGNYRQCNAIHHADPSGVQKPISGHTCRMHKSFQVPGLSLPMTAPGSGLPLTLDLCLPTACDGVSDVMPLLKQFNVTIDWIYCNPEDLSITDDDTAIMAVLVLSLFAFLMVAGTLMDIYVRFRVKDDRSDVIDAYTSPNHAYKNTGFAHQETSLNGDVSKPVSAATPPGNAKTATGSESGQESIYVDAISEKPGAVLEERMTTNPSAYPEIAKNGTQSAAWTTKVDFPGATSVHANGYVGKQNVSNEKREAKAAKPEDDTSDLYVWQRILLCFSLPKNTGRLLSVKAGRGNIGCLHGIRVMSLAWVILGHVILFMAINGGFANGIDVFALETNLPFQMIVNAPLSVDTFFFMSGFLTCFLFLKECSKRRKVSLKTMALYYFHRYWRLTPPLMIWVMICACIIQYVGAGRPGWTDFAGAEPCRKHWWVNLLYINNIYDEGRDCVGVTWFLAHDMMYYIVAPLALIPFVYRANFVGILVAMGMIAMHLASTIWLVNEYNFDLTRQQGDGTDPQGYSNKVYFKPWARSAPFFIGVICGWILHKTGGKLKMKKSLAILGWIIAIVMTATLTLVTYDQNKTPETFYAGGDWPKAGRVVYESLSRPLWACVIGWITLACATGYGGFINSILAWDGWLPLSRLSYSAYLVHLTIINFETFGREASVIFTYDILIYKFLGFYVVSYGVAFLLSVTVEAPLLGLEKVMLGK